MRETIFDRYGGFATVSRIVSTFYDSVLDSPRLVPFFDGVDTRKLIDHQTKMVASLMGGPASFTNEHLDRVHRRLGIDDGSFTEALDIMRETLEDFGLDETDIADVLQEMRIRKSFIVHA